MHFSLIESESKIHQQKNKGKKEIYTVLFFILYQFYISSTTDAKKELHTFIMKENMAYRSKTEKERVKNVSSWNPGVFFETKPILVHYVLQTAHLMLRIQR